MIDTLRLTAEEATRLLRDKEVSSAELFAAYRDAIDATLAIACDAARRIEAAPHLELVLDPELTVVVFRRLGWDAEQNQAWSDTMLRDQRAFVLPTTHHGESVLRMVFLHPECPPSVTDDVIASLA